MDVFVPGCPPRPEQLIRSIIDLQAKIKKTGTIFGSEFLERTQSDKPRSLALELAPAEAMVAPGDVGTATKGWDK